MPSKEKNDLYSNIQDAMWQNGEDWRGGWTAARQSNAGRGFGRLTGGQWGEGGGAPQAFTMADVATNEQRTTGLARKENIFLTPQTRERRNRLAQKSQHAIINKLSAVQRRATINITGGMSTTANDTLDVLSDLLPFHLLVEKHCYQVALHLASLPKSHPLHKPVINAANRYVKMHPTPLHYMMHEYELHPEKVEKIEATGRPNKWVPDFATRIADTKDAAVEEDKGDRADIRIYTDGSGSGGKIGASAVLYRDGEEKRQMRYCLGLA